MRIWSIVLAAGSGQRFGGLKQYVWLQDERVIDRSIATAAKVSEQVVCVLPSENDGVFLPEDVVKVIGGDTRAKSVRAALAVIPKDVDIIVVHDAARPLASVDLYRRVIETVQEGFEAAIPGIPLTDTVKVVDVVDHDLSYVVDTPQRDALVAVQTPQAFKATTLRSAHESGKEATDDAGLVEQIGAKVVVVDGETTNIKVTTPDDLARVFANTK